MFSLPRQTGPNPFKHRFTLRVYVCVRACVRACVFARLTVLVHNSKHILDSSWPIQNLKRFSRFLCFLLLDSIITNIAVDVALFLCCLHFYVSLLVDTGAILLTRDFLK